MNHTFQKAFTLVEILIVITVISILSIVALLTYVNVQTSTRDEGRRTDISVIQEALEKYYQQNGEYPETNLIVSPATVDSVKTLLSITQDDTLATPISSDGTNSLTNTATPTTSQYGYIASDTCAGNGCLKYNLYYRLEVGGTVINIASRY